HDADLLTLFIRRSKCRCVVESGLLLDRKRIHVGANEQTWSRAVLHDPNNAVGLRAIRISADMLRHGVTELPQFLREEGRGLIFMTRELGITMQVLIGLG